MWALFSQVRATAFNTFLRTVAFKKQAVYVTPLLTTSQYFSSVYNRRFKLSAFRVNPENFNCNLSFLLLFKSNKYKFSVRQNKFKIYCATWWLQLMMKCILENYWEYILCSHNKNEVCETMHKFEFAISQYIFQNTVLHTINIYFFCQLKCMCMCVCVFTYTQWKTTTRPCHFCVCALERVFSLLFTNLYGMRCYLQSYSPQNPDLQINHHHSLFC